MGQTPRPQRSFHFARVDYDHFRSKKGNGMGTETELKLHLDAADLSRLRRHPLIHALKRAKPVTRFQKSVYFDTPDFHLRDRKVQLRIRHIGRRRIQTVKTMGESLNGAWARGEWECEISDDMPEQAPLLSTEMAPLFEDDRVMRSLRPVFATEVRRTTYLLADDGWEVELAIDLGQVVAAQGSRSICEAEIELKSGRPSQLFDLALQLQKDIPGRLATVSKAERGYALLAGTSAPPQKALSPQLAPDASVADAFRLIARSCIGQLLANQTCLVETGDPEAVHQMRVALRRLRSAMNVFKEFLDTPETMSVREDVRGLLRHLGTARDSVVFVEEILEPLTRPYADEPGYAALCADFIADRQASHDSAVKAVSMPDFTRLILRLAKWCEDGDWLQADDGDLRRRLDHPARDLAGATLAKRDRKVRKDARRLSELDAAGRHKFRIEVKKLRYSIEFFSSLYQDRKIKRLIGALAALQDRLGLLNDIAVSRGRLRARAEQHGDKDLLWMSGMIAGWHAARVPGLLAKAEEDWKAYDRLPRFWLAEA
jgi:inorganic triphosphatase YgiF